MLAPSPWGRAGSVYGGRGMGGVDSEPVMKLPSLSSTPTLLYPTLSVSLWGGRVQSTNFCFALCQVCPWGVPEGDSKAAGSGRICSFLPVGFPFLSAAPQPHYFTPVSVCVPVAAAIFCQPSVFPTLEEPAQDIFQNPQIPSFIRARPPRQGSHSQLTALQASELE